MNDLDLLQKYTFPAPDSQLPELRRLLRDQTEKERRSQGKGNTEIMRILCVHLFLGGHTEDSLLIWRAKNSSMDSDASIDIQFLCGGGLDATVEFMESAIDADAADALARLRKCIASGDFEGFSPGSFGSYWLEYYGDNDG
jgi:hypothetical protein